MCSYQSPTSLFPPIELMSLAAVFVQVTKEQPHFIDAVANKITVEATIEYIKRNNITHVVSLLGFECFDEDIEAVQKIKAVCPAVCMIVFGHYPTLFASEILEKTSIDFVLQGEPEEIFYEALLTNEFQPRVQKAIGKKALSAINNYRVKDYNALPSPAYHLADHQPYHEPMMAVPFGLIQSARGCPYSCNYCVKSFGTRLTLRTPETIVSEILQLKRLYGIKGLRFIDDTFTVNRQRVIDLCRLMVELNLSIEWSCLSRTDNLDEEILHYMKRAGCKRIYFGIESGSQRILDFYQKGVKTNEALAAVKLTRKAGIESSGFFMLGLPQEEEADFLLTKQFIAEAEFDYIGIGGLVLYPGTPLFDFYKDEVEFSLFPYINRFKDKSLQQRYIAWNKELYNSFLSSPHFIGSFAAKVLRSPIQAANTVTHAISYQLAYKRGFFHHIQKHKESLNYAGK